jgi:hypothetical protein
MSINCKFCQSEITPEGVNEEKKLAVCGSCNSAFSTAEPEATPGEGEPTAPKKGARTEEPLPRYMAMELDKNELYIAQKWFKPVHLLFVLALAVFITAIVAMQIYVLPLFTTRSFKRYPFYISLIRAVLFIVTAGLAYFSLTKLLNSTQIAVDYGKIAVRFAPMFWTGARSLDYDILTDVLAKKDGKTFSLFAVFKDGRIYRFLRRIQTPAQALYIEQEIENLVLHK